jgi:hypothetical protein
MSDCPGFFLLERSTAPTGKPTSKSSLPAIVPEKLLAGLLVGAVGHRVTF